MKVWLAWLLLVAAFALGVATFQDGWIPSQRWQVLCGVGSLVCVAVAFALLPQSLADRAQPQTPKERFEIENSVRDMLAKSLGGLGVLLTLGASLQQMQNTNTTQRLAVESATTERLYKIVDKLNSTDASGKPKTADRLAAVHLLERIMNDSPRDAPFAIDVLCAYVRDNAPATWFDKRGLLLSDDRRRQENGKARQARRANGEIIRLSRVLNALRYRPILEELPPPNLQYCDLTGMSLGVEINAFPDTPRPDYRNADFSRTVLEGANLRRSDLRDANFNGADLSDAHLEGADLTGASFRGASMKGAFLRGTVGLTPQALRQQGINDEVIWK
jgi:hypothetical protein